MTESQAAPAPETERVAEARSRAQHRLRRQRETLRPVGLAGFVVVVISAVSGNSAPALHGKGVWVAVALAVFTVTLAVALTRDFPERDVSVQTIVIFVMGAAGVAVAGLQQKGGTQIAAGIAVFMAIARLPLRLGVIVGLAITVALGVVSAIAGGSSSSVAAGTLVTVLFGIIAQFLKQSRESQDHAELLLAQLEDAREEQTRAAALAERGRIAGELHDVLAHSLSGAAIQLQGARVLAERQHAKPELSAAIDHASELVTAGLANARQAVGTLRGDPLPSITQLDSLVDSYRADMNLNVTLRVVGQPRALPAGPSLALYRGAQEALTNVARYAPSACAAVVLSYEPDRTTLSVENGVSRDPGHLRLGGGHGLDGMRERIERTGGTMSAGPTADGWRVEIGVPA